MCGLTGVFGSEIDEESLEAFRAIAVLSYLRGEHSTGVADYVVKEKDDNRKAFTTYKKIEKANDFFSPRSTWDIEVVNKRYYQQQKKMWKFRGPDAVMAHARAATIGAVKIENAHPFKCGHIIGMHNGTVRSHFEGKLKYETDSEAIFALIAEKGEEEALQIITDLPIAAFALTWFDTKTETFNIFRNSERPLFFVKSAVDDEVFYSSDSTFLNAVLPYFNINSKPEIIPPLIHYKFDLTAFNVYRSRVEKVYKKEEVQKGYEQNFFQGNGRTVSNRTNTVGGTSFRDLPFNKTENEILTFKPFKTKRVNITTSRYDEAVKVTRIYHEDGFELSKNKDVSLENYRAILSDGCSCCGMIPPETPVVHMLQDGKSYICEDCISDGMLVRYAILLCESEMNKQKEVS